MLERDNAGMSADLAHVKEGAKSSDRTASVLRRDVARAQQVRLRALSALCCMPALRPVACGMCELGAWPARMHGHAGPAPAAALRPWFECTSPPESLLTDNVWLDRRLHSCSRSWTSSGGRLTSPRLTPRCLQVPSLPYASCATCWLGVAQCERFGSSTPCSRVHPSICLHPACQQGAWLQDRDGSAHSLVTNVELGYADVCASPSLLAVHPEYGCVACRRGRWLQQSP